MRRRISIVASCSGNGKTTLARRLSAKLGVPAIELDALHHLPGWTEASAEQLRASVEEAMRSSDSWVIDGSYTDRIGDVVLRRADTVVWLDLPLPLALFRLVRRAIRDIVTKRDLFNGNRQTWRFAFFMRDSLVSYAIKSHFRRRRIWPEQLARLEGVDVVRLRSPAQVEHWFRAQ